MVRSVKMLIWGGCLALTLGSFQSTLGQETPNYIENFALANAQGKLIELQDFADQQAVVVIFTSSNCSWAHSYEERIIRLHEDFISRQVAFIGINSNDPSVSLRDESSQMRAYSPFAFPYLKDSSQAIARQFKATKNPEVFVLVPEGNTFRVVYQGKIDDNPLDQRMVQQHFLREALEATLNGRMPLSRRTSPQGCNIRWSESMQR